jgi:Zn-dependent alcohol dehydrogenase
MSEMNAEKSIAAIAVAGLAVLCCAGPLLLATIGSVAISASVLTGSLAIVMGVVGIGLVGVWAYRRRPSADPKAVDCCALESAKRKSNT